MYGDKSVRDLEEDLAEGFREYVMTREEKGILNKIKNFFKSLFIKVKYWSSFKPHIYSYYKNINKGKYSNRSLSENIVKALYGQEQYTQEMQEIKDKAIANGTFMKAPNGNPTNLTERQWVHVRTKAFKEWFGDWENDPANASKVIDENEEPLVVYHGSKKQFNTFDFRKIPNLEGGFYFTSDKKYAENYGTIMYPVFLNIKNPTYNDNINSYVVEGIIVTDIQNKYKNLMYNSYDGIIGKDTITGEFKYTSKGKEYVIIKSSNQAKSATDNVGSYSRENNNIYYRKVSYSFNTLPQEIQQTLIKKGWSQELFDSISDKEKEIAVTCAGL